MNKILKKLRDVYEFVFNDTVIVVGEFVFCLLNILASLFFAISGFSIPNIPNIVFWVATVFWMIPAKWSIDGLAFYFDFDEDTDDEDTDDEDTEEDLDDGEDDEEWEEEVAKWQ